jgi:hypothetical protein
MPEYLSPGVYVTEVALNAHPIEGVSTSTASLVGPEVIARLQRLVDQIPRDWTDLNEHDPGIALVELFAWLTETLIYRHAQMPEPGTVALSQMPERGTVAAARLAVAALALVKDRPQPHSSVLKQVRFFEGRLYRDPRYSPGQLLEDDDLSGAVDYTQSKCRNHFAYGTVCGLQVTVQDEAGPTVHVTPGYVVDPRGRTVVLDKPLALSLPTSLKRVSVIARPRGCGPLSIAILPSLECEFLIVDEPKGDDFKLGQLEKSSHGWRVVN